MKYVKYYRMWLEDTVEPEGGTWCYMGMDDKGFLWQLNFINKKISLGSSCHRLKN
jgi:hypothetical protein